MFQNGEGNLKLDWTAIERRQPKLTENEKGRETSSKEKYSHGFPALGHLWDLIKIWN